MRYFLIAGCLLLLLIASCSPAATTAPDGAQPRPSEVPTEIRPTSTPVAIVENPPPCWGADLIYHLQLQLLLLVNCITDPSTESPLTLWGWDGMQWQRVAQGGPPGRILGGAAYDAKRNVLVLYGGRPVELGKCSQETWEWDGQAWAEKESSPPTACDHVKMVYDASSGETVLFSGLDPSENPVNETWSWNGVEWKRLSEEGPESRGHFGFVYDPTHEQTLLYGGYASTVSDEFWVWKDNTWQEIELSGPGTLSHLGMTYDTDRNALYIFGGATSRSTFSSFTDKTWVLRDGRWQELAPTTSPSKRGSPSMGYDPVRKKVVVYGGFSSREDNLKDTWEWDGQEWSCLVHCE